MHPKTRPWRLKSFDPLFKWAALVCAVGIVLVVAAIILQLTDSSMPSLKKFGLGFVASQEWDPVTEEFGAASSIFGTLVSTATAMAIAVPISLVAALFLVELAPPAVGVYYSRSRFDGPVS
jgi:phosphate transport system permease protein